ncbi:MAG: GNAT family N-acetyltransferase [Kiritimatiellae bacterium]|nr:GNAT family N-acetyltransferase [Kiritimatiellia bacterium]MDD4735585.1 GNAT family N-acetyltransferase [Kiritimatiellia bacterium]
MNLIFTPATPKETALIGDLAQRIWPGTFSAILPPGQVQFMLEWMYNSNRLTEEMTHLQVHYDLLFDGDNPIGYVSYGPGTNPDDLKLHKLYVLPEYQRHGVGHRAFVRVMDFAQSAGNRFIILQVNRHNEKAIAAYRKYGFRIREEAVTDIGNGFVMDDYILEYPVR